MALPPPLSDVNNNLSSKINTSAIKNNLTTTAAGGILDARQGKILNDNMAVESVSASVSLVQLNERCGSGKKKTFYYTSVPSLPTELTGSMYLFVTLYKSPTNITVCDAIGIKSDGSVVHAYGYYASYAMIWTAK